jgi:tripartite-type tricarboxylate transporter receptor subunit TctC
VLGAGAVWLVLVAVAALAQPAEDFYRGKTIRFIVGFSPGGGFDTYSRAIARHIGKHVPGRPSAIVENMAGAGSLIAANHLYERAAPDGLVIGNWSGGLILQQLLGRPGIQFDARRFEWVGVPIADHPVCVLGRTATVTSLAQWTSATVPVKLGATAPGAPSADIPRVLREVLGIPVRLVEGYKGLADVRLAIEAGEVAGTCLAWESVKATWPRETESGRVDPVLQVGPRRHPDLGTVPNVVELVPTDAKRRLLAIGIEGPAAITRVYALPPGTPRDRVRLLRDAFMTTMRDPEFLAETKRANLDIDPKSGAEVEAVVAGLLNVDPGILAMLRQILAPR